MVISTMAEMGAELVNTVLGAFRRGMDPCSLFANESYGTLMTYPAGGDVIKDVRPDRMMTYFADDYSMYGDVEHPYACCRIPLHGSYCLEIWYELSEAGMRGIAVRLADNVPSNFRTTHKADLFRKVDSGKATLFSILHAGTVKSSLAEIYQEVLYPLSRSGFTGYLERWESPVIQNSNVDRLIAVSAMGNPILCYSPDGETLYEVGLKVAEDEKSADLEAS